MTSWTVTGYRPTRELGTGASGRVVLAHEQRTGTPVAIKYLGDALRSDRDHLSRFRAEARLLAALTDPNVVRLYEYVEEPTGAAIVMELVNGVSLRALLREHGPIEPEAALCVLKGSLLALAAAHAAGVVHRDYKPENVLVDTQGASKLADFGIASRRGRDTDGTGTPAYMAPEQWRGVPADAASDIYSATATFVECLTGRPPYSGLDLDSLRRQHEHAPLPLDGVPETLHPVVRSGLAKEPGRRPKDARTLLAILESAAAAGYGDDWEAGGRRQLRRRVGLLALLLPLGGGPLSGTAVAATALGRAPWLAYVAVLLVIALAGGVGTSALTGSDPASDGSTTTVAREDPRPTLLPTPSATTPPMSASPTATPASRTTTTATKPAGGATTGATKPAPPAVVVTSLSIVSFAYQGTVGVVSVHVTTSTTAPITLKLRYAGSNAADSPGSDLPVTHSFTLSGSTQYDVSDGLDGNPYSCVALWFGVKASTVPAASTGGDYADLNAVPC